jgi:2-aminoadipate transaminase
MGFEALFSQTAQRSQPSIIRALLKLVQDPATISLAGGTPDSNLFDLPRYAALAEKAAREQGRSALQYGETQGALALREQIAAYLAGRGWQVSPADVLITTGSQQGIDLLARVFLDPGDVIAMEEPGYLGAIIAYKNLGAQILSLPIDGIDGLDVGRAEGILAKAPKTPKFAYLTPTYQNPSGACLTPQRRQALADLAQRRNLLLVEDDPYGEISFNGPPPKPLAAYAPEHTVFLGSFSKMSVPGLRVGFAVGPQAIIQKMTLAKESADVCSSVLSQAILAEFLKGGHLQATLPGLISAYHKRRDALFAAATAELPQGTVMHQANGGFFLWAELPAGMDTQASFQRAIDAKVAYVPGHVFFAREGAGRNTMRLSYCAVEEAKLIEGAKRLGAVLRQAPVHA